VVVKVVLALFVWVLRHWTRHQSVVAHVLAKGDLRLGYEGDLADDRQLLAVGSVLNLLVLLIHRVAVLLRVEVRLSQFRIL